MNINYSIIYSFDMAGRDKTVRWYQPPKMRKLWTLTEGDSQYEYSYLGDEWERGKHRKYIGILNQEEFDEFIDATYLTMEDVQTMGSLGAPGFGFGWSPAISFRGDEYDAILSAYVTPFPIDQEPPETAEEEEKIWDEIYDWMLEKYG